MFITSSAYLLFKAKSIGESADTIYMILSSLACAGFLKISDWKISNILELIGEFEQFIEKSMGFCLKWGFVYRNKIKWIHLNVGSKDATSRAMYIELIEKIERLTQLIYIGVVKLTIPGIIIPALSLTLINLFVYDLGDDSFFLPFPVM